MTDPMVALEVAEIDAFTDLWRSVNPELAAACGLGIETVGDGVVMSANRIDVLAMNRATGLGLRQRVGADFFDDMIGAFTRAGSPRFFVQVAPTPGHERIVDGLERHGVHHYNNWMRLRFDLSRLPNVAPARPSAVTVREIGVDASADFGRIVSTAFGYPPAMVLLPSQTIGRPGWRHYLAYDGDTPIGAAAMFVNGEAAWFGFAGTDAAHRKKGAQHALVMRRLHDAAGDGCRWVSVETAEDTVTKDAPSFRNLRGLGFEIAYKRANYLWVKANS